MADARLQRLGTLVLLTDDAGTPVYRQAYDPWGRERDPETWDYGTTGSGTKPRWLSRGYTGHEMLPEYGLINMNGRMYDPLNGRMLRPDNFVTYPDNTQSYNRYSYAMNNPMKYVDPDGNNPIVIGMIIGAAVASASYTYQVASSPAGMSNWNWGDFAMQTLTGGVNGGVSGGLSFGIGNIFGSTGSFWNELGRSGAHGLRSYITSGGDYSAAVSGALGSTAGSLSATLGGLFDTKVGGSLFAASIGGISAGLSGGDMLNGFGNGLIVHLLNQEMHEPKQRPKNGLSGFPGSDKGSYNHESRRWRWKLPNGDIAEWDKQHGEVEVFDKSGKNHKGGFDPQTGEQNRPADPSRTTPKMEGAQEAINTVNRFRQIISAPASGPSSVPLPVPTVVPWLDFAEVPLFRNISNTNNQY